MLNPTKCTNNLAAENTRLAHEYFERLSAQNKPDEWVMFRARSMQHLLDCLGQQPLSKLNPSAVIDALCKNSTHHRSGQPLSEDRLRHILEHTREFLDWANNVHHILLKQYGYFEMLHWQQMATEANRSRGVEPASLSASAHVPPPDVLNLLVWSLPTMVLGKIYGVSDVAFGKWCKKANVQKPPRGFWAKCQASVWDPHLDEVMSTLVQAEISPQKLVAALEPHRSAIQARRRVIELG